MCDLIARSMQVCPLPRRPKVTKSAAGALSIENMPLSFLKLDRRNPRKHSKKQIAQIARSIEAFGFNVPILVDEKLKVLAGHGRVLASRHLGWQDIPVIRLAHLSETQARAFSIADNRLTDNSTWDDKLLSEIFRDLSAAELEFDIEAIGFSVAEIDLSIEGLAHEANGNPDPADDLPATPNLPPVTKPGDLWLLGRHRLYCGSAIDAEAYKILMQDRKAQMVFTDPPYNVPIDGHVSGKGKIRHREFEMASGEMTPSQFTDFLSTAFHLFSKHSSAGSLHFCCMDWRHLSEILAAGERAYSEMINLCVWVKSNGGMGSLYRSQHELIFVFKNGVARHRNNVQLGRFGRNRTNVWTYPCINSFGRQGDEGNLVELHPTVKPVALIADAILDCSARGDVVLDGFAGSGSTVIAAERVGRVCHAMDLDPIYVDTALRRWQRYTGDAAIHAVTKAAFDSLQRKSEGHHGRARETRIPI
jgi:DNA modification methylase